MSDRTTKKPENLDSKGFPVSVCDKIRTRDLLVRSREECFLQCQKMLNLRTF